MPGSAPRRSRNPLRIVLVALALIVAIVGCSIGALALLVLQSQGVISLPLLPPSAATILAKPLQGGLRDAAVHETIRDKDRGAVSRAEGVITFSPTIAMRLSYSGSDGQRDELWAGGLQYERLDRSLPWDVQPGAAGGDLSFLGWNETTFGRSSGTVVGEETLPQGRSWHVKDVGGYDDFWIRQSDGYPIKVESERAYVHVSYTFDGYNQGTGVQAPSGSEVSTTVTRGAAGQRIESSEGRVQVSEVRNPYTAVGRAGADRGYRLVSVNLSYTNSGDGAAGLRLLAVNDSRGFVAGTDLSPGSTPAPGYPVNSFNVAAGQTQSGWVTFEVRDDAQGLTLQVGGAIQGSARQKTSGVQPSFLILVSLG
jgi:hypothetical protein